MKSGVTQIHCNGDLEMKRPSVFFCIRAARKNKATIGTLERQIDHIYNEVRKIQMTICYGANPVEAIERLRKIVLTCSTPTLRKLREEQFQTTLRVRKLSDK